MRSQSESHGSALTQGVEKASVLFAVAENCRTNCKRSAKRPELALVEVLAASFNRTNDAPNPWKNSVIVRFLESGSAWSLHEVSKKDLNLGLSKNLFGCIIWTFDEGADHERG